MTDVGGVDPDGVGVVQTGRFLADFDLEYRVNMIQAYFSESFARCAHRQILKHIWRNPGGLLRESNVHLREIWLNYYVRMSIDPCRSRTA